MRIALDLDQVAEEMKRQNLWRQSPSASEEEIEQGVRQWLADRPGSEHGDAIGQPRRAKLSIR